MRTLTEIANAVRRNESVSYPEMRYAVVAYDVLLGKLHVERNDHQLEEFFKAAEACPKEYAGWENDPENPDVVKWHTEHINNRPEVFERAMELLDDDPPVTICTTCTQLHTADECPHCLDGVDV